MNPSDWLNGLLSFLAGFPAVGKYLAMAGAVVGIVTVGASALVALLHGIILALQLLSGLPALAGLKPFADKFKQDEDAAESWYQSFLLPILDRLSAFKVPAVAPVPAPAPKV